MAAPSTPAPEPQRIRDAALALALTLVAVIQIAIGAQFDARAQRESPRGAEAGFPLDDAWIHLVYARSFAAELRLDYNPGEAEAGQSSLLWGLLLAPVHAVAAATGTPIGTAVRRFGIAVWIAAALAAALLLRSSGLPGARFGALAAALLIALDPALAFAAASGMEPLLLALCGLAGATALLAHRPLLAGLAGGLAILARPEGALVAALLAVAAPLGPGVPRRLRAFVAAALPALALAAVWVAFCWSATGRPLPNTFYAKAVAAPALAALGSGAHELLQLFGRSPFAAGYVGYIFLLLGATAFLVRCSGPKALVLVLMPWLFAASVAASRPLLEPTAFYWERYLLPAAPWLAVPLAAGIGAAGAVILDALRRGSGTASIAPLQQVGLEEPARAPEPGGLRLPEPVIAVLLALALVVPFAGVAAGVERAATRFAANVRDVDATNVEAALWVRDNRALPANALVAAQDAGAIRYFGQRAVLDLLGLNDRELIAIGLARGDVGRYLRQRRPDAYLLLDPIADADSAALRALALQSGMREVFRARTEHYSLFGPDVPRSVIVLADLPP